MSRYFVGKPKPLTKISTDNNNSEDNRKVLTDITNMSVVSKKPDNPRKATSRKTIFWDVSSDVRQTEELKTDRLEKAKGRLSCAEFCTCDNNRRNLPYGKKTVSYNSRRSDWGSYNGVSIHSKPERSSQTTSIRNPSRSDKIKQRDDNGDDEIEDPYKKYQENPFLNIAYVKDINNYLLQLEDQFLIKADFLRGMQITPRIRALWVDWMMDVQLALNLSNESFHSSVSLLDNYLVNHRNIGKDNFQVLAITCVFVAVKYDLVYPSRVLLEDFLNVTEYSLARKDIVKMEMDILRTVDFKLNKPQLSCFLRRYGIISNIDKIHHCCSKFFVDACLLNYATCYQKSSLIAAAATFLSLSLKYATITQSLWDEYLSKYSKYKLQDFLPIVRSLALFVVELPSKNYSTSIMEKYSMGEFANVKEIIYSKEKLEIIKKISSTLRSSPKFQ